MGAVVALMSMSAAGAGAVAGRPEPRILLSRSAVLFGRPVTVEVTGLEAGQEITVRNVATLTGGTPLSSHGVFRANARGVVDLGATAPVSGTYTGRDRMGLFWSLQSDAGALRPLPEPLPRSQTNELSVEVEGTKVASRRLVRRLVGPGVSERQARPDDDGFYGAFFAPPDRSRRRPAVLVLGGSDGGLTTTPIAAQLASEGYPSLAVAYFRAPGLPATLQNIPLEYLAGAMRWLAGQPGVDGGPIVVAGLSRGSEAALLLGVHYPDLVSAVIGSAPSSVVNPGLPDFSQPAWTLGGAPIPSVSVGDLGQPSPPGAPAAVIPVEQIGDPILLVCGEADHLWPSCGYADAIAARLASNGRPRPSVLRYPEAGHSVAGLVAYAPQSPSAVVQTQYGPLDLGGSPAADAAARARAWPRLLRFLERLGS